VSLWDRIERLVLDRAFSCSDLELLTMTFQMF
jgi:hypothetical protein